MGRGFDFIWHPGSSPGSVDLTLLVTSLQSVLAKCRSRWLLDASLTAWWVALLYFMQLFVMQMIHCWAFVHFLITWLFYLSSTITIFIDKWQEVEEYGGLDRLKTAFCRETFPIPQGGFDKDWPLDGAPQRGLLTQKKWKCQNICQKNVKMSNARGYARPPLSRRKLW